MIFFAIPGDLNLPTGGYAYSRKVLDEWIRQGIESEVIALPGSFPYPADRDLHETEKVLSGTGPFLIDGLAYGAFSKEMAEAIGPRSVVLVHHPLCDEQGLDAQTAASLEQNEREALRHAAGVIATSPMTARDLAQRFGVAAATVAIPGTDRAPQAALSSTTPKIISVGTVTPRKGYGLLVEALIACRDLDWTCEIIGADDRDPSETARVQTAITGADLSDRIKIAGTAEDMTTAYQTADLFVSASLHEGYGMAVVEAMAHGLPVVTSTAGALKETAPVARLVAPGNVAELTEALRPLITDQSTRQKLGAECRAFAEALPGWDETARIVAQAVDTIR